MTVRALPSVRSVTESARVTVKDLDHGGDLPSGLIPHAAPKRASRSEVQIKIDARVAEVYQAWCEQGKEKVWLRCPHAFYAVPEVKVKDMRDKIRKAGRLLQVQIRFGRADLYDQEGNVLVVFTVVDKSSTTTKDDT